MTAIKAFFFVALAAAVVGFYHLLFIYVALFFVSDSFKGCALGVISMFLLAKGDDLVMMFYPYIAMPYIKLLEVNRRYVFFQLISHFIVVVAVIFILCSMFSFKCISQYIFCAIYCFTLIGFHTDYCKKMLDVLNN